MPQTMSVKIGARAACSDGECGHVHRIVIDPVARTVTHVIVEPTHRSGLGRLVPIEQLDVTDEGISIRCTRAEFDLLDRAEETEFLPGTGHFDGYRSGQMLFHPYYALDLGDQFGPTGGTSPGFGVGEALHPVVYDGIPSGEVTIRRGEPVQAVDGAIGRVQGLVVDPGNRHVTHVLLQEGHLWGRRQVAIPIGSVTRVDENIVLDIDKQQVEALPDVSLI